jgi:hypothetical protein
MIISISKACYLLCSQANILKHIRRRIKISAPFPKPICTTALPSNNFKLKQVPSDSTKIHSEQLRISARVTNKPRSIEEHDTKITNNPSNCSHPNTDYRDTTQLQLELHAATQGPPQIQE